MNIRKLVYVEDYVKKTIEDYSKKVRSTEDLPFPIDDKNILLSVDEGRRIAICLHWLNNIITENIDNTHIEQFRVTGKNFNEEI